MLFFLLQLAGCAAADVAERQPREARATSSVPRPNPPVVTLPQPVAPSAPAPVTSCDAGGCWSGGSRYNGGAGGTYLDKNGRLCQGNGTWMQCF